MLGGLKAAGILPQAQKEPDSENGTLAAAVQGSVAAVIQDRTLPVRDLLLRTLRRAHYQ